MKYTVIEVHNDRAFGKKAAQAFIQALRQYHEPDVILPTGNTPLPFYAALREMGPGKIPAFRYRQLDEYLDLWMGHPKLFLNEMKTNLLDPLEIPIRSSFNGAADPYEELMQAKKLLPEIRPAKIAVIGIGENGHVGFNEPGSSMFSDIRIVDLTESTIMANKKGWAPEDGLFPNRAITLGMMQLREAEQTILLVRGESKAQILAKALTGPVTPDVPASYLQMQENVTIVADRLALSKMPAGFNFS